MKRRSAASSSFAAFASVALWISGAVASASASTVTVHVSSSLELIAAMKAATASRKPTVIKLAAGTYGFSESFDSAFGPSMLPPVKTTLFLVGADRATTIIDPFDPNAGNMFRILTVLPHGSLQLRNLTLSQGVAVCTFDCRQTGGGGIGNFGGYVFISNCEISRNATTDLDGGFKALGGGILSTGGNLQIEQSSILSNASEGNGGGIVITGGFARIAHSIISGNRAHIVFGSGSADSGGISVAGAGSQMVIDSSTISGNVAGDDRDPDSGGFGAGIANGGSLWISNSAITENMAEGYGAGGGILNGGQLAIKDSTIGGNSAYTQGGGIYNSGRVTLRGVTISGNFVRGVVRFGDVFGGEDFPPGCETDALEKCLTGGGGVWNEAVGYIETAATVVAANSVGGEATGADCNGTLFSVGFNLLGTSASCTLKPSYKLGGSSAHDLLDADAMLGELEDNGIAGYAHYRVLAGSPLIDADGVAAPSCAKRDQIGARRTDGDGDGKVRCDIGAIEFQPVK